MSRMPSELVIASAAEALSATNHDKATATIVGVRNLAGRVTEQIIENTFPKREITFPSYVDWSDQRVRR